MGISVWEQVALNLSGLRAGQISDKYPIHRLAVYRVTVVCRRFHDLSLNRVFVNILIHESEKGYSMSK